MRKLVILFSVLFSIQYSSAQTYVSMFDDTLAQWNYETNCTPGCCCVYGEDLVCELENGDTLLGIYTYKKLRINGVQFMQGVNCGNWFGCFSNIKFVRESNKKVFVSDGTSAPDILVYDFNLGVGDTVPSHDFQNTYISSIDSVLIGSNFHKRYHLIDPSWSDTTWLIEGIGSESGPFELPGRRSEDWTLFKCYGSDNTLLFTDSTINTTSIGCSFSVGIEDQISHQPEINIYPNPVATNLTIEIDIELAGIQFQLYDAFGRLFNSMNLLDPVNKVDVSILSSGIYFYQVFSRKGMLQSGKLIVE
jgi:hypothetical protein